MIDATTGWATAFHIFRTMDGGATWQDVNPLLNESTSPTHTFFLNEQLAWVWEGGGKLWRTEDGGQRWASVGPGDWGDFWFNDLQHGWKIHAESWGLPYIHYDFDTFSTTQDGGQTWEAKNPPPSGGPAYLAFPAAQTAWDIQADILAIVGEGDPNLGVPFFLETTTDGGQTWVSKKIPPPPEVKWFTYPQNDPEGAYLDAGNCDFDSPVYSSVIIWKFVLSCEKQGWAYTTINQGQTWIISPLPPGQVRDTQFINPTIGWLFVNTSSYGQVYQTTDGGQTWTWLSNTRWEDVQLDFVDAQTGWMLACVHRACFSDDWAELVKTTDSGQTWQTLQPQIVE